MVKENKKNINEITYEEVKQIITFTQPLLNKFDMSIIDMDYLFNQTIKIKDKTGVWRQGLTYGKDYNLLLTNDCIKIIPTGHTKDKDKHVVKFEKEYIVPSDANLRKKMTNVIYPFWCLPPRETK